jgi:hypothetical protein
LVSLLHCRLLRASAPMNPMSAKRTPSALGAASLRCALSLAIAACGSSSGPQGSAPAPAPGLDSGSEPAAADAGDATTLEGADAAGDGGVTDENGVADANADAAADAAAGTTYTMLVTFYGWEDNSPPGDAIAFAKSDGYPTVHDGAGGTGSYADPLTLASDRLELAVGTLVYLPFLRKYAVMEDDCTECDTDWASGMQRHIDVWMNSNGTERVSALNACEDQWTQNATSVEVDPPSDRTVDLSPLFDPATNTCASSN